MEPIYSQKFEISDLCVDCFGRLKSSMLLYFAQEAAGQHCIRLGLPWEHLAERGLFWAVIRHRIQVERLPMRGETITVTTWPMPTTRVAYPRALEATDEQGNVLFRIVSLWVLMDLNTRAMVLPGKSGVEVNGTLRGTELAVPGSLVPKNLSGLAERKVHYSQLDRNGHMNNTKYLEFAEDLLPAGFHSTHVLKECVLCYLSEVREGQILELGWEMDENGCLQTDIRRKNEDKAERVFSARMVYERIIL